MVSAFAEAILSAIIDKEPALMVGYHGVTSPEDVQAHRAEILQFAHDAALLHDVVEIDAGDTYAYDADGLKTQKAREEAAKERVYSLLPDDQKQTLSAIFDEFEADETPEAHFAHTMDNLQPLLLNNSNGGSDWAEHDVNAEQVYGRQRKSRLGSEKLYELTDRILKENIAKGSLKK